MKEEMSGTCSMNCWDQK